MTRLLIDTSVLIKWFHSDGESELTQARALRTAHVSGELTAHMLDLVSYEVGNVLTRALRWSAADVADQLDDLHAILGPALVMTPLWLRRAATLASDYALSFYDASWAAAADVLGVALVSADRRLQAPGLAESPSEIVRRGRPGRPGARRPTHRGRPGGRRRGAPVRAVRPAAAAATARSERPIAGRAPGVALLSSPSPEPR